MQCAVPSQMLVGDGIDWNTCTEQALQGMQRAPLFILGRAKRGGFSAITREKPLTGSCDADQGWVHVCVHWGKML